MILTVIIVIIIMFMIMMIMMYIDVELCCSSFVNGWIAWFAPLPLPYLAVFPFFLCLYMGNWWLSKEWWKEVTLMDEIKEGSVVCQEIKGDNLNP